MPARVNNPRAADQLRREYGVMGDRLSLQVDDVVVPVAIVSDLTAGSGGVPVVRRAYATFSQGATAGEYPTWRLEVPAGFIVIVRSVLIRSDSAGLAKAHFGSSIAAPANLAAKQFMDGRLRSAGLSPAANLAYGTQVAALAAPFEYVQCTVTMGIKTPLEWLFGRDDGQVDFIEFQAPTLNEASRVTMEWDEIPLV